MKVTVIDYGIGNLFSVARALERCGAEVQLTRFRPDDDQLAIRPQALPGGAILFTLRNRAGTKTRVEALTRSEERRVGKECCERCRSRWSPYH